jgi:hypothetical protein
MLSLNAACKCVVRFCLFVNVEAVLFERIALRGTSQAVHLIRERRKEHETDSFTRDIGRAVGNDGLRSAGAGTELREIRRAPALLPSLGAPGILSAPPLLLLRAVVQRALMAME